VNFAVKASIVAAFLEIHGVDHSERPSDSQLPTTQAAERASKLVAAVECWP